MRVKIEERAKKRKESEGTEKKDETTILRRRRRPLFKNHLAFFFWFSIFIALVLSVDLLASRDMVTIVRDIMGITGNAISLGLFLSRVPTFKNIIKKKAVEQYLPIPELTILLKCMLWVLYGLPVVHPNSCLVLTSNAIGLFLQAVYLIIFLIYAAREIRLKVLKVLAVELVVMTMLVVVVLQVAHTHEKRSLIVGIPCVIFGSCMYAAPLAFLQMLATGRVPHVSFTLYATCCLNDFCWMSYARLPPLDIYVLITSYFGAVLSLVPPQLWTWCLMVLCRYAMTTLREDHRSSPWLLP